MAALRRLISLSFILSALSLVCGEYTVVHYPKHVHFLKNGGTIDTSEIPAVVLSYLGLPLNSDIKWKGLSEGSPFQRPKAAVVISVSSLPNGRLKVSHKNQYKTSETEGEFDSEMIINHVESMDWKTEPLFVDLSVDASMVDLKSRNMDLFKDLPSTLSRIQELSVNNENWFKADELRSLNITNDADLQFASELFLMKEVVSLLKLNQDVLKSHSPDIFHFKVSGLEQLESIYGTHSDHVQDAVHLLKTMVEQVANDFRDLYFDNCVVQVIGFKQTTHEARNRKARSLLVQAETQSNKTLNLAPEFSDMYPVIFNIVLWTMIAMALAIFAIAWGIWNMDPGRDSLIYRMTSQRKKND